MGNFKINMKDKIRWGIVAPGRIAHSFANDLKLVADGEVRAVASRSLKRAEAFSKEYNAQHAFGSYEALFECDEVDAVYIATPHTSHAELAVKAMDKGKHVLCEKPMGLHRGDVEQMIAAAERNQVFLMEAMWSRFNPAIRKAKQMVDDGELGEIAYVHVDFGFYALDRDEKGRLLNPELAGGSLLDIGIYPIFLAYLMLGYPDKVLAASNFYKTGVEIQTSMIFQYAEAQAILYSGLKSKAEMKAQISCSKGTVFLKPKWHEAQGYIVEHDGQLENFDLPTLGRGYAHEIIEVHECLKRGDLQSNLWSHKNSLDLMSLMDEVRRQTGIRFPMEA